jgi:hypothetical protein
VSAIPHRRIPIGMCTDTTIGEVPISPSREAPASAIPPRGSRRSKIRWTAGLLTEAEMSKAKKLRAHQPLGFCALFKLSRKVSNLLDSI